MRIRIALFDDPGQAEPIRQQLMQAGITAEIHRESRLARLWFVTEKQAGARLEVQLQDVERAEQLLSAWQAHSGLLQYAIHCPECRSLRIDYPQFTEKSLLTNLVIGMMAALRLIERDYYCEVCHCTWEKKNPKPPPARRHMAPDYFLEDLKALARSTEPVAALHKCPSGNGPANMRRSWRSGMASRALQRLKHRGLFVLLLALQLGVPGAAPQTAAGTSFLVAAAASPTAGSRTSAGALGQVAAPPESPTYFRDVLPIFMGKCGRCHNGESQALQNWLDYRTAAAKRWELKRRVWDSWKGSYFKQPMPTGNSPEAEAMTDEERTLIRDWVESGAHGGAQPAFGSAQSKEERMELGKRLFSTICASCHQANGQGIPGRFPPLAGSDLLNGDKHRAIKIVINGLQGEVVVNGRRFNNSMPKFPLSDQDVASALTYVYNSFGNSGKDVTPGEVSLVRREKDEGNSTGHNPAGSPPQEKSPYE